MGIIWSFAALGTLVGLIMGSDAASTVDPSVVGGSGVETLFQYNILRMYAGWGFVLGLIVGFLAWLIREVVSEVRFQSRRGAWSELAPSSPSDATETLDSMAARMAARREAIAAGVSVEDFERGLAEALRIDRDLEEQAYRKRLQDVGFNLRWPEG